MSVVWVEAIQAASVTSPSAVMGGWLPAAASTARFASGKHRAVVQLRSWRTIAVPRKRAALQIDHLSLRTPGYPKHGRSYSWICIYLTRSPL